MISGDKNDFQYDISVIVLTYHPDYRKLFHTLYSIINQSDINFEVIVSDDGTPEFDAEKVTEWFVQNKYDNYTIIANPENKGTVKNVYASLQKAKGNYVKLLSPGDYLYSDDVLKKICEYMKQSGGLIAFGNAAAYSDEGDLQIHNYPAPRYLRPFIKKNKKGIWKNFLVYKDNVLGATLVFETEYLLKYIAVIQGEIIYAEDYVLALMIADGADICYWNDYLIWYEYGGGISTARSEKWAKRLWEDNKKCFSIIVGKYSNLQYVYDMTFDDKMRKRFWKRVRFYLHNRIVKLYVYFHRNKKQVNLNNYYRIVNRSE